MNLKKALEALDLLYARYPDATITLTGGEPFLHNEWETILEHALDLFKGVCITSNGSIDRRHTDSLKRYIHKRLYVQFSIDGTSELHDSIRGAGKYSALKKNIDALKTCSDRLVLSTTVTKENIGNIRDLAYELNGYSFRFWKLSPVQEPVADGFPTISSADWNNLLDDILLICRFKVYANKLFDFKLMDRVLARRDFDKDSMLFNCGFGSSKFYVFPDFNIYPCTCVNDMCAGNIFDDGMDSVSNALKQSSQISVLPESVCFSCKYKDVCNGGCPGYSLKAFGKIGMGDARCPIVRKSLNT